MGVVTLIIAVRVVSFAVEVSRRVRIRRRARELSEAHEILSCLVAQVYAADRGQRDFASEIWKILGYVEDCEYIDSGNPVRLMVFRRLADDDRALPTAKYVVAIRGTRLTSLENIKDDFRIVFESLKESKRYDAISKVIKEVVGKHKEEGVCIAGHSLGAAFGLLATRELALEDTFVETHLFNPPFVSSDVLLKKGWDTVTMLVAKMSKSFEEKLVARSQAAKASFARAMESEGDTTHLEAKAEEFFKLQPWTPTLYVNHHDPICNGYTKHFQNPPRPHDHPETQLRSSSAQARVRRKISTARAKQCQKKARETNSFHLIPSANMFVNYREKAFAHELNQWYKHPTVNLTTHQCSLLIPEPNSTDQSSPDTDEITITATRRTFIILAIMSDFGTNAQNLHIQIMGAIQTF